jgi:hypothetical protein
LGAIVTKSCAEKPVGNASAISNAVESGPGWLASVALAEPLTGPSSVSMRTLALPVIAPLSTMSPASLK